MVGDPLKVRQHAEVLADFFGLVFRQVVLGDLGQVDAQFVFIPVEHALEVVYLFQRQFVVDLSGRHRTEDTLQGFLRHGVDDRLALRKRQGRMLKESHFQPVHIRLFGCRFFALREQHADDLLQHADERRQHDDDRQSVQRVQQRDGDHRHGHLHEAEADDRVEHIEDCTADDRTQHVDDQVDKSGSLAVGARPERAEHDRHAGADADTHEDREGHVKLHRTGDGQRLQDADRRARALDHRRDQKPHEDAEDRIGKAQQQIDEVLIFAQRRDRARHHAHAVHQDGKAQHDPADVLRGGFLREHPQRDTDQRHKARQHRGIEIGGHARAGAAQTVQTQDPARDTRSEDRPQHDADRLPHLHHARVDEADDHDRGCRR